MPSINLMTPRSNAPTDVGAFLRERRAELAMSQSRLAGLASLSRKTIIRIERGAIPSADTLVRLVEALELPEGSLSPGWDLPPGPSEADYGGRVRARRRAMRLSQEALARRLGVSGATLSRFERGIAIPRRWFAEWIDDADRERQAIIFRPLADALGFDNVRELHEFCMSVDPSWWSLDDGRGSDVPSETYGDACRVAADVAFPTMGELRRARYRAGNSRSRPSGPVPQS